MKPRLASNSPSSYLSPLSAGMTGVCHHTWLGGHKSYLAYYSGSQHFYSEFLYDLVLPPLFINLFNKLIEDMQ
jgi:thiosulfate reductase cytochrome b subunit